MRAFARAPLLSISTRSSRLSQDKRHLATAAIAHSSWFKLPGQGMTDYELLARGSSFLIRSPQANLPLILVSAHVAAPHRFHQYFPQQWLRHVTDRDCQSLFQSSSLETFDTQPLVNGFRHSSLDVAAFLLDESSSSPEEIPIPHLSLALPVQGLDQPQLRQDDRVTISGFRLIGGESGSGTEKIVETELPGRVSEVWSSRVFVDTGDNLSEMGMCGGPVVLSDSPAVCVGILEGLVPEMENGATAQHSDSETHRRLQNKSVLIGVEELTKFVRDVETEILLKEKGKMK